MEKNRVNREQVYYDKLKLMSNEDLVKRGKELSCSVFNKGIELDMVCNLLINRNADANEAKRIEVEFNRFVENTTDENERYGL